MTVLVLERVPASLRGELTRWLLEPRTNVFVGSVTAMVRDGLWAKVCAGLRGGAATLLYRTDNEQGFAVRQWGSTSRKLVDFDGLTLVRIPN